MICMAMRGADEYAGMNDDVDSNARCMFDHVCESTHMRLQLVPAAIRVLRPRAMLTYNIASCDARAHTAVHGRPRRVLHRGPREVAPREGAAVRRNDLEGAPLGVRHGDLKLVEHEPAAGVVVNLAVCTPRARAPHTDRPREHGSHNTTQTTIASTARTPPHLDVHEVLAIGGLHVHPHLELRVGVEILVEAHLQLLRHEVAQHEPVALGVDRPAAP